MSSDINKNNTLESELTITSVPSQPHNSRQDSDNIQHHNRGLHERKESAGKHASPFLLPRFPSHSEPSGINNEFMSPEQVYFQQQHYNNFNGMGMQPIPQSAVAQYKHSFMIPTANMSAKNNTNAQQQYMLNGSMNMLDNERIPNPLFSSIGNINDAPFLTGSSNFSPLDMHNPLMKNPMLIPNTGSFSDNYLMSAKPSLSFSPTMIANKNSLTKEEEMEFEQFKQYQNEKNVVNLKKTTKKVEKKKKGKASPSKRKKSEKKSISASGVIKPQLLEVDNSILYNNMVPVSSVFNNNDTSMFCSTDTNTADGLRNPPLFQQGSATESNKYFFNENTNIVDLNNNMLKNRGAPTMYNFFASPIVTTNKHNKYNQVQFDNQSLKGGNRNSDTTLSAKQKKNLQLDIDDFKVNYEDAFLNASQKYNDVAHNNAAHGTSSKLGSLAEAGVDQDTDMNFINYLVLKEKTGEIHSSDQATNKKKVTKKAAASKKKRVNTDSEFYLNIEAMNNPNNQEINMDVRNKQTVKRGRKPKPIKIIDQTLNSKTTKKSNINTGDVIAPQYINSDVLNDGNNKVLSESTKKVIDEIKHNALNGTESKLVTFSPLAEFTEYPPQMTNSGTTLPMSLSSARQFPKTSAHNFYGVPNTNFIGQEHMYGPLNTSEQMKSLKKISPFDSNKNTSSSGSTSSYNNALRSYEQGMDKTPVNSEKATTIKAALKNTTKAISGTSNNPKMKLVNSSSLDFFRESYENDMKSSGSKVDDSNIDDFIEDSLKPVAAVTTNKDLASNDSIKEQFMNMKNENNSKLIENFTYLEDDEPTKDSNGNIVKIVKKNTTQQKQNFTLKKMLGNANSNIKQSDDEAAEMNQKSTAEDQNIVQSLEKMFAKKPAKKKPMKKAQYINIFTQVLKSSGNLLVKTSVIDKPQEPTKSEADKDAEKAAKTAKKNLDLTWLKNSSNNMIKLAHKSIVEALKNDPHFTTESLTKKKKGLFSCLHCEMKFSTILQYAEHLDEVGISGPFKCPFSDCCWKYLGMKTTQKLRRHCALQHISELNDEMKTILKIKSDSYPEMDCLSEYCDKKFVRKDSILRHQQMVHSNVNSRFNKRLEKVQHFIKEHYSQLKEEEKKILMKQYMKGALNLPTSYKIRKKG